MTLVIKNANSDLTKAIKDIVKPTNANLMINNQKQPSKKLLKAIKQAQNGEVIKYTSFEDFRTDIYELF
ncbi:hypothetical protein [Helicobacter fennelliae]|uniref:Uncharacterized protein n=1 Tax=Helicobacter fennelliae MRY12-0050 TaxID=1325130 RepID=T1CQ25_9HELI|nr:hypothetical protein [Helicobacter fennelliae]GAD18849.1 hypothetical protein HFN_2261 [Helicobacter fennelliae MRY12-0050]STP06996.1 Uncharacterised protein [Helicobacter fennelliae]